MVCAIFKVTLSQHWLQCLPTQQVLAFFASLRWFITITTYLFPLTGVSVVGHAKSPSLSVISSQLQLQYVWVVSDFASLDVNRRLFLSAASRILGRPVHLVQSSLCTVIISSKILKNYTLKINKPLKYVINHLVTRSWRTGTFHDLRQTFTHSSYVQYI